MQRRLQGGEQTIERGMAVRPVAMMSAKLASLGTIQGLRTVVISHLHRCVCGRVAAGRRTADVPRHRGLD